MPDAEDNILNQILSSQRSARFNQRLGENSLEEEESDHLGEQHSTDENQDDGIVVESGAPNLVIRDNNVHVDRALNLENQVDELNNLALGIQRPTIDWPNIGSQVINEFQDQGYIPRAFPKLFAHGLASYIEARTYSVTFAEYFKHLLYYKDNRFAEHSKFRFFAMNTLLRHEALKTD